MGFLAFTVLRYRPTVKFAITIQLKLRMNPIHVELSPCPPMTICHYAIAVAFFLDAKLPVQSDIYYRPPDVQSSADLGAILLYYLLLSIFFRQLPSDLTEQTLTKTFSVFRSKCDLKMRVKNLGYPFPPINGDPKPTIFDVRLRKLRTNFRIKTTNIFERKIM